MTAWLARVLNPGVPWWVAIPCNVVAGAALALVILDPVENLATALALLVPTSAALYGAALVCWCRRR
jgi:hypothetical protein